MPIVCNPEHPESSLQSRLERTLQNFARAQHPSSQTGIPYSTTIPAIARRILQLYKTKDERKLRNSTRKSLLGVVKDLDGAVERLNEVGFLEEARRISAIAQLIKKRIQSRPTVRQGRPSYPAAQSIADYVLKQYERFSRQRGRRTVREGKEVGAFNALLKDVFQVLGVKASADVYARRAESDRVRD